MLDHDHKAHSAPFDYGKAFAIGVTLNLGFVLIEAVCGLLAHSLALLSDAGHNLGDVAGLLMAWAAVRLARWQPTTRHTYGFQKASVLAALVNALLLLVAVGGVSWEAIRRLTHPVPVDPGLVTGVACIGIVINAATAFLFMKGRKADLNIRSAFLHMTADALISAGVAAAGIVIALTGWLWIDPAVSLAIGLAIMSGTWGLLRETINLILDAVPEGIDADGVRQYLQDLPEVRDVHHLHIWGLSTTHTAMTVHLVMKTPALDNAWIEHVRKHLHDHHGIMHVTLQLESPENNACLISR